MWPGGLDEIEVELPIGCGAANEPSAAPEEDISGVAPIGLGAKRLNEAHRLRAAVG